MAELIIVWDDGTKEIHEFNSVEKAEEAGKGYKMAFGNQVAWYAVRKKVVFEGRTVWSL